MEQALEIVDKTEPPLKWFVLDTAGFSAIDYTSLQMLMHLHGVLAAKGIKMVITIPLFNLREQFKRLGLIDVVGSKNIYDSFREAVEAYRNQKVINKYLVQSFCHKKNSQVLKE